MTGIIEGAAGMGRDYIDPFTVLPAPDGASPFSVAECAQAVQILASGPWGFSIQS